MVYIVPCYIDSTNDFSIWRKTHKQKKETHVSIKLSVGCADLIYLVDQEGFYYALQPPNVCF